VIRLRQMRRVRRGVVLVGLRLCLARRCGGRLGLACVVTIFVRLDSCSRVDTLVQEFFEFESRYQSLCIAWSGHLCWCMLMVKVAIQIELQVTASSPRFDFHEHNNFVDNSIILSITFRIITASNSLLVIARHEPPSYDKVTAQPSCQAMFPRRELLAMHVPSQAKSFTSRDHSFVRVISLRLNESGAHQLINMSALQSAVVLVTLLEQHSQHLDGRVEAQSIGSSPTLDSGDANARLNYSSVILSRHRGILITYTVLSTHVKLSQDLLSYIESLLMHARALSFGFLGLPVFLDLSIADLDGSFLKVVRIAVGARLDLSKFGVGLLFNGCISGCGFVNDMIRHCIEQSVVFLDGFGVALSQSGFGDAIETLLAKRDGSLLVAQGC
jgi:hypothetical protein